MIASLGCLNKKTKILLSGYILFEMPRLVNYNKTTDQRRYRIFTDEKINQINKTKSKKSIKMSTKIQAVAWKKDKNRGLTVDNSSERQTLSANQSSNADIKIEKSNHNMFIESHFY